VFAVGLIVHGIVTSRNNSYIWYKRVSSYSIQTCIFSEYGRCGRKKPLTSLAWRDWRESRNEAHSS
jgi:hypothetical protein